MLYVLRGLFRTVGFLAFFLSLLLAFANKSFAACQMLVDHGKQYGSCTDFCLGNPATGGNAWGQACYSCGTDAFGYYCYSHEYICDTSCGGGGGGPSCFLPGTVVDDASGGTKIEDLKVGDTVSSFANDKVLDASVSSVYKSQRDHYYQLSAGDYSVSVTAEHPFYVGDGVFREVKDLVVGAVIYVKDGAELVAKTLTEKRRVDEVTDVYNLSVDSTNTYFANDFAVHNKGGGFTCPMTPINCPAGTVRGPTIVGSQCQSYQCQNSIGTAQQVGNCCNWNNPPQVCGDWYDCPTPANPGKVCRDCEEEEPTCTQYSYDQYECVPTCNAVAPAVPTLTSPANGADLGNTTVNLLWNSVSSWGTACAGTRQYQVII